jgi:hypothetical protein
VTRIALEIRLAAATLNKQLHIGIYKKPSAIIVHFIQHRTGTHEITPSNIGIRLIVECLAVGYIISYLMIIIVPPTDRPAKANNPTSKF